MKQIVYVSVAAPTLDRPGVEDILAVSRRNNAASGVTGLLCLLNSSFLQILEGPEEAVDETFARIGEDPRHESVLVLLERAIEGRDFAGWKMGFRAPAPGDAGTAEAFDLTWQALNDALPADGARQLLFAARSFYKINSPAA